MQSDESSCCGEVVFYSFNKASRNEDILEQIYTSKYVRIFYEAFNLITLYENAY